MASRPKLPIKPISAAVFAVTVPAQLDPYVSGDALPLPEVIEKDSDSVWALWSDAVGDSPDKDAESQAATQLMGLHELPRDADD